METHNPGDVKIGTLKWPYEIKYEEEKRITTDVLIIGAGMAGCFCAIHVARRGAKVTLIEKGAAIRSGASGAGIDHWMMCADNPGSKCKADEMISYWDKVEPFCGNHTMYICMREAYDALLDLEELGVKVRDSDGDFEGAPFRDPETKLMYAYDYDNNHIIRIFGADLKKALYKEMVRLGVEVIDRTMATSLLTEGGEIGKRVVGATGLNLRTGEFVVVNAKATVLATAKPLRLWEWGSDLIGSNADHDDPNCAGDGDVMAWRAGAKLTMMERSGMAAGAKRWPAYGTGNAANTWYPCTIVDSDGKPLPWTNRDGTELKTIEERTHCAPGQRLMFANGVATTNYDFALHGLAPDLPDRIKNGEFKLPFFADLPAMPEHERKIIFGVMVGNEGKTKVPVYEKLKAHGFDPEKDMLMVASNVPELAGGRRPPWCASLPGVNDINIREMPFFYGGGVVVDWKHRTSLESLYAIGNNAAGSEGASGAASNGRYCGRNLAAYIKEAELAPLCEEQIAKERTRIYKPLENTDGKIGWKEVQLGSCRLMQQYLGKYKSEEIMKMGLWWFDSLKNNELRNVTVNNPHELARLWETDVRISVAEIILNTSLARQNSSKALDFHRLDRPGDVPWEEETLIGIWQDKEGVKTEDMPLRYWLPEGKTYRDCYEENCCKEEVRS